MKQSEESYSKKDEAVDLQAAISGDLAAYNRLVERYQGRIYGMVYNMTGNNSDAEDLVQEVFIKAFHNLQRFKGNASFYTWIYRIAVNHTLNFLKKRKRHRIYSLDDVDSGIENDPDFIELSDTSQPFREADISELQKKLNEAIQQLSDKHRLAVVLHDIEGMPHEEIAKIMKCSEGTVRSRLFYARRQLRNYLQEYES
jgi:RNA polymerase sigma factor (sigma-70 family)